ncbi:type VII secretion system-associated protein [Streptomyces sp. AK02-01A]|uniref:type VII secretion system-associated protein n=1 Tax=Streptomyces sp. AK02-01A TaxID=3028648 RepID=UPI0029AB5C2B|nr:type VII secretion system-associated protein [Streptomyces sp. AK02-01A]MDX3850297.1 type VII secretion system-associated protein [Streptomyces sp. AK02-01A]
MADSAPVNLDKAWLENFLNQDIETFKEEIRKILGDGTLSDGGVVPALSNLLPEGDLGEDALPGGALPLTIGGMVKDGATNGQHLSTAVVKMITDVTAILDDQKILFDSIDENLQTTLEKLFKAQGENLEKIDGQKFLDIFSDVDDILGGNSGGDDD